MGQWVEEPARLLNKMRWWENITLHLWMKYCVVITMWSIVWWSPCEPETSWWGPSLLCLQCSFSKLQWTRAEGRLGVVLQRTDNCYLKPELPHVQQRNEDLSLCSGFYPTSLSDKNNLTVNGSFKQTGKSFYLFFFQSWSASGVHKVFVKSGIFSF